MCDCPPVFIISPPRTLVSPPLFPSVCLLYVAPRPPSTLSLSSVLLLLLSLSCLHRGNISTMFRVLAEHLAPEPIQPDGQYVCSNNVCTQSRPAPARVAIQIGGQRESELRRRCKNKISVYFVNASGGRIEPGLLEPTAQNTVRLFKGIEG